jgi:hypothetical protein
MCRMAQRGACGGASIDRRRGEATKGRSQGDRDKKDQNMMCIGNTLYITVIHNTETDVSVKGKGC